MSRYQPWIAVGLAGLVGLGAGCSFRSPSASGDAAIDHDAPPDARVDVPPDASPDAPPGSRRVTTGLVALWRFGEGTGDRANDSRGAVVSSPPLPPIPLSISSSENATWVGSGLTLTSPVRVGTPGAAHVNRDVLATGEVTIEVWVSPAAASQGGGPLPGGVPNYALVLALSPSYAYHNAMIAQVGDRWQGRVLTEATTANALPVIETAAGAVAAAQPVHLVLVASATERALYVDGTAYRAPAPNTGIGALNKPTPAVRWFDYFPVSIGQERDTLTEKRPWLGTIWLAAIYNRALTPAEIQQNLALRHDCDDC